METIFDTAFKHIAEGGPGVAWVLVVYLLLRLHQLADRQHKANLDTVAALTIIKTVLFDRLSRSNSNGNGK